MASFLSTGKRNPLGNGTLSKTLKADSVPTCAFLRVARYPKNGRRSDLQHWRVNSNQQIFCLFPFIVSLKYSLAIPCPTLNKDSVVFIQSIKKLVFHNEDSDLIIIHAVYDWWFLN
ncbi:MAG: hypothetical protein LBH75_09260 [Treponema sp.]|jgi:hypothetical protein|nr:hypothetical protein [Treponema sp.]